MARIPKLMPLLHDLIALPSVSSTSQALDQSNLAVVERLAQWCTDLGFNVEIMPVPGYPGKANLIATLGTGMEGLVLAGHTDTVPYDSARWHYDPFYLTEEDGCLYGLGTSDMKGFFALVLETVQRLQLKDLQQPLILLATADEESSMSGAQALLDAGRALGRHTVIGEPTGLRPARMHKGILMEAVRLRGQSGHSSDPSLGNSALEGMYAVIGSIMEWRNQLQAQYHSPLFSVPMPTLNLGHIHGGDNPNRICGECELHLDLRPLPGMSKDALRAELRACVDRAVAGCNLEVDIWPLFSGIEALETPANADIVRAVERLTGHHAGAVGFGTEGPYFHALGMDTVIWGPGDINQAHQPDEYLRLDRLTPTIESLTKLIVDFCRPG